MYICIRTWIEVVSGGVYNQTYFDNRPEEQLREGVLYGVVLVNTRTFERECIKVGIASGKDWRHVIKRSRGFKGYELRIQRTYHDTINSYTRSSNTKVINQNKSLVGIRSVSKFHPLFYLTFQKINLDIWSLV